MSSIINVQVPASTANVGPGYDVFGIALTLYNTISIEKSELLSISITGPQADISLPLNENNLVYKAIQQFYLTINKPCPNFKINIDCQIPLASGLGSSSTAIVGGIAAANKLENEPLNIESLVKLAWKIEGHPDNTTTAILGGFIISTIIDDNTLKYKKLFWPEEWKLIICHPHYKLSTQKAREAVPKTILLKDAIFNMSCCSFLVSAVCTKDTDLLKLSLKDRLHQPFRANLIPGMNIILQELSKTNIIGAIISGAGPSLCIITEQNPSDAVNIVKELWQKENLSTDIFYPGVNNQGLKYF